MAQAMAESRPHGGSLTPLVRTRLLERFRAAAKFPIALVIAPAGYGKSVLLRQYLETVQKPSVRFTLRSEHKELLGFLRGFAEALSEHAPHALTSLAGAYERNQTSARRAADLARWMHVHIDESFTGTIAIDDLHIGDDDADIARFVTALIELCKGKISWLLASRSTSGLPIGSWLAYRDADMAINESDLRFTLDEATTAARDAGLDIGKNEMRSLLQITDGWPAALTFALTTSTRSSELRNVSAVTREMMYRFLAEQVYNALTTDERELLEVAVTLPTIDVGVLERAGFDHALRIVEGLHERTAFISHESPGVYRCHDLFRDFLRHQSALAGRQAQQKVNERAAHALEATGDIEHAVAAYAAAGAKTDILRLLQSHGFDLLEQAQSDVVAGAIQTLDLEVRQVNPHVLSLLASIEAANGRFSRAESLFNRALANVERDQPLNAAVRLRLATLRANAALDATELLAPVASDETSTADIRAEAMSLTVATGVLTGRKYCLDYIPEVESLLPAITSDVTRVKVLHRLGVIQRHTGDVRKAITALHQASDLAHALHMYAIAARVNAVLSNLMLQEYDDEKAQLRYSEIACEDAARAGDVPTLRTALLQNVSAHVRRGDDRAIEAALDGLTHIPLNDAANELIMFFRAVTASWQGRFREAHTLMAVCWKALYLDIDRVAAGAQLALFLACDGKGVESSDVSAQVRRLLPTVTVKGPFRSRAVAFSIAYLALAEALNGKLTMARRIARTIKTADPIELAAREVVETFVEAFGESYLQLRVRPTLEKLEREGYWDASLILAAACRAVEHRTPPRKATAKLTIAETAVLRMLAEGMVAKEIAADTVRSINTVRAHIASAVRKLECDNHSDAVKMAQRLGLL